MSESQNYQRKLQNKWPKLQKLYDHVAKMK
jgi:hypothetical protein